MRILTSLTFTTVFIGLGVGLGGYANPVVTVASIAVYNISQQTLNLRCGVSPNTQFYHQPGVLTREWQINPDDAPDIDIEVTPSKAIYRFPDLYCVDKENELNWFGYSIIFPEQEEAVTVHGRFHYNSAYPGSITFENT